MAEIQDTDLLLVNRNGRSYKATFADFIASGGGGGNGGGGGDGGGGGGTEKAPEVNSIILSENAGNANRFTNSTFETQIAMISDGNPVSSRELKVTITGDAVVPKVSSDITAVEEKFGQTDGSDLPDVYGLRFESARNTKLSDGPSTSPGTFSIWAKPIASGTQSIATGVTENLTKDVWQHIVNYGVSPTDIGTTFDGLLTDAYFFEGKTIAAADFLNDEGVPLTEPDLIAQVGDLGANGYHWNPNLDDGVANGTSFTPENFNLPAIDEYILTPIVSDIGAGDVDTSSFIEGLNNRLSYSMLEPVSGNYIFKSYYYANSYNIFNAVGYGPTPYQCTFLEETAAARWGMWTHNGGVYTCNGQTYETLGGPNCSGSRSTDGGATWTNVSIDNVLMIYGLARNDDGEWIGVSGNPYNGYTGGQPSYKLVKNTNPDPFAGSWVNVTGAVVNGQNPCYISWNPNINKYNGFVRGGQYVGIEEVTARNIGGNLTMAMVDDAGFAWVQYTNGRIFWSNNNFKGHTVELNTPSEIDIGSVRLAQCTAQGKVWVHDYENFISYGTDDYGATYSTVTFAPGALYPVFNAPQAVGADGAFYVCNQDLGYQGQVARRSIPYVLTDDQNLSKYDQGSEISDLQNTKRGVISKVDVANKTLYATPGFSNGDEIILYSQRDFKYIPDLLYDSPYTNYTWLDFGKQNNLEADDTTTGISYTGDVDETYYFEQVGVRRTYTGGDAFNATDGFTYNFGQYYFRQTQTDGTQLLRQPVAYIQDYDRLTFENNSSFASFNVGDIVEEVSDDGTANAKGKIYAKGSVTLDVVTAQGEWNVGNAISAGFETISGANAYARIDVNGVVSTLSTSDPGFQSVANRINPSIQFPAAFADGTAPDTAISPGTSIKVTVRAVNTLGSSEKTSNTITPT